jgi:adenine-specific DNA-methyltransferase
MAHERLRPQFLFDEEKIKQLKQLAPECFEDGKINFETLRQNLGDWAQDEEDKDLEHFGLFWPGKRDARKIASMPPQGTLAPVYGEGLKADGKPDTDGVNDSKNIFIEGENLEVLKILQKSYAGKIKMIYIDPPYNTGNDFVYDDDFTEPLQEYLRRTGQVDEEGKPLTTNKRSDGRFHSKWLSMMYPRLKLARNLLVKDGVIFISIDDNEIHNLKAMMNEPFGEENFVACFIWEKRTNRENRKMVSSRHDYLLTYCLDVSEKEKAISMLPMSQEAEERYKNPDNDHRGPWKSDPATAQAGHATKSQFYVLTAPNGKQHNLPSGRCWAYTKGVMDKAIGEGRIWFGKDGNGVPRIKTYLDAKERGLIPESIWFAEEVSTNEEAKNYLKDLFDGIAVFDTPKPVELIDMALKIGAANGGIVLDFFAGTSATAEAVIRRKEGNQFIMVQMPELCNEDSEAYKAGYKRISEISRERIKRASKRTQNELKEYNHDLGFKAYLLKSSHYKHWLNQSSSSMTELEKNLELFNQQPLIERWTQTGLICELILIEGFSLSSLIEHQLQYRSNNIFKVSDEYCEHSLLVCLDKEIKPETIKSLELSGNDIFICLDSAISNVDKLKLSDKGLIKTI